MPVLENATVVVNVESKFSDDERRIKFDGNDQWFGALNELNPDLTVGNEVKVGYSIKGKQAVIVKVKVLGTNEKVARASQSKDEMFAERDRKIAYQNARNAALEYLTLQHQVGVLDMGTGKKESKATALSIHLDTLTAHFYADTQTLGAVERYEAQANESTDFDATQFEDPDA